MIWTMKTPKLYIPIAICKLEGRKTKVNKCNNKSSTHNVATNKLVLDERKWENIAGRLRKKWESVWRKKFEHRIDM